MCTQIVTWCQHNRNYISMFPLFGAEVCRVYFWLIYMGKEQTNKWLVHVVLKLREHHLDKSSDEGTNQRYTCTKGTISQQTSILKRMHAIKLGFLIIGICFSFVYL